MSSAAAFFDPARPDETAISLFYTTGASQLAVSLKNSTDGPDPSGKDFAHTDGDHPGHIRNASQLAVGSFRGFSIVVAVTAPNDSNAQKDSNQISVVSPVYLGLAKNSLKNVKVTLASSEVNAWVYFLDGDSDTKLKELNYSTSGVASYPAGGDILLNSSLAAWYDPIVDERYVVYQEKNNKRLKEFNVVTRSTSDIASTEDAKEGTSVAVTYCQAKAYLYYSDKSDNVRRVVKSNGQWGSSSIVRDSPPIGLGQLSVVAAYGFNHLFYQARDDSLADKGFTHLVDRLD